MEITPALRKYTEGHMRKLTRVLRDRFGAHVILTAEKHRRIAEITLKFRDRTLVGVEETSDVLTSINGAINKLTRQALRSLERKRTRKRRPKPASAILLNVLGPGRADHEGRQVLQTERIAIKPLTIQDAIEELESARARSDIVVFHNPETERLNVLYRRHDGNLGLIEPET
jgi:ribosome hibernation promoting factor